MPLPRTSINEFIIVVCASVDEADQRVVSDTPRPTSAQSQPASGSSDSFRITLLGNILILYWVYTHEPQELSYVLKQSHG